MSNILIEFRDILRRINVPLIVTVVLACMIGIIFITSATSANSDAYKYPVVQAMAMMLGLAAMFVVIFLDYEYLSRFYIVFAAVSVVLLAAVLVLGAGGESTGTEGWFILGPISFQPAELTKLAFIISFAKHIEKIGDKINHPLHVLGLLAHAAVPIGLILMQPDFGTAVVYVIIFGAMLLFSGLNWLYITGGAAGAVGLALFTWFNLLNNIQKARVVTFLDKDLASADAQWQLQQSLIAVSGGKIYGMGLFNGKIVQSGLYASHNDLIFATIAEEGGLLMCIVVIALIFGIICSGVNIAMHAKNKLGQLISIGIVAMWLFHTFENIGMTIDLMPITGIPLPFISYGGSSLVANFLALGLLLSVQLRPRTINF